MKFDLESLKERAKELNCLYRIHELLHLEEATVDEICRAAVDIIPSGWQYPDLCFARIRLEGKIYEPPAMESTKHSLLADIKFNAESIGRLEVYYANEVPLEGKDVFLKEERVLLQTIADWLGYFIAVQKKEKSGDWEVKQKRVDHWRWRWHMVQKIAAAIDPKRFGVRSVYVFGSTDRQTAGIGSDIDLLIHFAGSEQQKKELMLWLDGWSACLQETNFLRTGYKNGKGLLDVHLVTDEDIAQNKSYASKISSIYEPAYRLNMKADAIREVAP
jgi:predicted nucleotidyltransferase